MGCGKSWEASVTCSMGEGPSSLSLAREEVILGQDSNPKVTERYLGPGWHPRMKMPPTGKRARWPPHKCWAVSGPV